MNIFIVEDDINIIRVLERIITDRGLGNLFGYSNDGANGMKEIQRLIPDIVLVDLLMPGKDGITLVKEVKTMYPEIQFIMISQVSSKDMIGKAYQSGVEYFISKPINAIEVESVIGKVGDKLNVNRKLSQIQSLFTNDSNENKEKEKNNNRSEKIKRIMRIIGISGEAGSQDILNLIEQRIRRTALIGMKSLANLGIEDYMNEVFIEYSNGLYNFEQVKTEMDYIRGKSKKRGKVNLKKFIDGMVFYSGNNG